MEGKCVAGGRGEESGGKKAEGRKRREERSVAEVREEERG